MTCIYPPNSPSSLRCNRIPIISHLRRIPFFPPQSPHPAMASILPVKLRLPPMVRHPQGIIRPLPRQWWSIPPKLIKFQSNLKRTNNVDAKAAINFSIPSGIWSSTPSNTAMIDPFNANFVERFAPSGPVLKIFNGIPFTDIQISE